MVLLNVFSGKSVVSHQQRKFSTKYEDHVGLLHKFASGGFARLRNANLNVDYEDVFQETCVSYMKATKTYDADSGIGFGAYMGRSVINNFNKLADRLIREAKGVRIKPIEELRIECGLGSDYSIDDLAAMAAEEEIHPLELIQNAEEFIGRFSRKSDETVVKVIEDFLSPSPEILEYHKAALAHYHKGLTMRIHGPIVKEDLDLRVICRYHDIPLHKFVKRINEVAGIDIR